MMTSRPGEFWVAEIGFTDGTGSKKRPVLVLWLDGIDTVFAAVTSVAPRTLTDVPLHDWQSSGLRTPSTVRLSRLDCLDQVLLRGRIGAISKADSTNIKNVWAAHIKPQF
jgi:mRNA interferase MazF